MCPAQFVKNNGKIIAKIERKKEKAARSRLGKLMAVAVYLSGGLISCLDWTCVREGYSDEGK